MIRKDVFAANVSGVSLRVEKNGGLIENATTASARVSHSEQLIANAKRDPRLNEALLADPVDQSMIATLEAELGGILAPIEDALEKAQAAAAATHALAATALAENVLFEKKLQSLQLEGPFSEHDSVYPASSVNFALKRITGGVGFHETLIKTCCGLTEECAEAVATFELELNEFHENKNQEVVPAKAPAGSVDSTPPHLQQSPRNGRTTNGSSRGARSRPCFCGRTFREARTVEGPETTPGRKMKTFASPVWTPSRSRSSRND